MVTLEGIAQRLGKYVKAGDGYLATCPVHEDSKPSLKLSMSDGKLLFFCHTGCPQGDILEAFKNMGLLDREERRPQKKRDGGAPWERPIEKIFDYNDKDGNLKYQSIKFSDGKSPRFLQRQPVEDGRWKWNLNGVKRIPYNLQGVYADKKRGLCVVEGEKDVESLSRLNILATSFGSASSKFKEEWAVFFADRKITLIPDDDEPGRRYMNELAQALTGIAESVKIMALPNINRTKGFDVSDWIDGGGTAKELRKLARSAYEYTPPTKIAPGTSRDKADKRKPSLAEDYLIEWRHTKKNGLPLATLENVDHLLRTYGVTLKYNIVEKAIQLNIPNRVHKVIDNARGDAMNDIISLANRYQMASSSVPSFLKTLSSDNAYNPIQGYVEAKPWDGIDRMPELFETLGAISGGSAFILMYRWLISCIAAIYEPGGVTARGVLVLQGDQNIGKTWWLKRLVGKHQEWFKESGQLDPKNKDDVKTCLSYWIVELGEIDGTLKRAEMSALKAFLSKNKDEVRLMYDRENSVYDRRTIFCGSVNPQIFLNDRTGTTRFWVIPVGKEIDSYHKIDMQQVWAQAWELYKHGEPWSLTLEESEMLAKSNRDFESVSPYDELILTKFKEKDAASTQSLTATEVCIAIGYDRPTEGQVREVGMSLRKYFGMPKKTNGNKTVWELPYINPY